MNSQEILTPEEQNRNTERKRELIELVASGEAILIVGAGSSMRVDYPDWACLLKKLENLTGELDDEFKPDPVKRKDRPLEYAEDIKSHIYDKTGDLKRYYSLLYNLYNTKLPLFDNFHEMLVSLPFRGILTTNYDVVLEAALNKVEQSFIPDKSLVIDEDSAERVHEFLMEMIDKSIPRRIAHLHGQYDYPKSIILSSKDYQEAYGLEPPASADQEKRGPSEWTLHRKLLWALLATRRAVFIGFSMKDPYLNRILDAVSKDLWRWDKSTHYAILGISPDRSEHSIAKELKHDYGIDTVFYPVFDNDDPHKGLYDIVVEIAEECGVEVRSTIIPQEQSDDNDRSEVTRRNPKIKSQNRSQANQEIYWIG